MMPAELKRGLASIGSPVAESIKRNEREIVMLAGLALVFGGVAMVSLSAALVVTGAIVIRIAWPPAPSTYLSRRPD